MKNELNRTRLRQLRFDRGYAARQLSNLAGVDIAVVNRLETEGLSTISTFSVAQLQRIADVLQVPIGHLFDDADRTKSEAEPSPDAATLGATLLSLGKATKTKAIADSFNWDLAQVADAANELTAYLKFSGLTVQRGRGKLALVPLDDTHEAAAIRVRNHALATTTQRVVSATRAKLLYKIEHQPQSPHTLTESNRHHVALLIRTGHVTEDQTRNLVVSDEVLRSIYPDGYERVTVSTKKSEAARIRVIRQHAEKLAMSEEE